MLSLGCIETRSFFVNTFWTSRGMMHLMDHEIVNEGLLKLKESEGLDVQLSYDGLRDGLSGPINIFGYQHLFCSYIYQSTNDDDQVSLSKYFGYEIKVVLLSKYFGYEIKVENQGFAQKAKIKWGIEADENSKFFHAMVNKKRSSGFLPRGCNTSFIAHIPKVPNPMVISDFRPISLIGARYKIIAKVLANRLARVIDSVISQEQSAFIKHRQILDGPLMVNEAIQWCKRKKANLMKSIDIASISCSVCDSGIETLYHTLWTCSLATTVWNRVLNWLELSSPILSNIQGLYGWLDALHTTSNKKDILEVICGVVLWSLWIFRNETIFGTTSPKRSLLFDKIVDCSFR
nr:RNA-directed DNA polymerase, eukaryota, reverse transcriptase zinc-binding domain protein [Tanacetum cinerariifolium]